MRARLLLVALTVGLVAVGCGGAATAWESAPGVNGSDIDGVAAGAALPNAEQGTGTPRQVKDSAASEKPAAGRPVPKLSGTRVKVRGSEYGKILVDARGRTLYLLDSETDGRSECYGDCAKAWPPLLTKGVPKARGDADQDLLGRTTRHNGGRQVTYRGHPLYRYAPEGPREILCQDVLEFGGTWLVVKPIGKPVR